MALTKDNESCCGCRTCVEVCPVRCIQMQKHEDGFFYPLIEADKCIECGACENVCPKENFSLKEPTHCYVAYASDKSARRKGSSGGIFGLLAEWTINKGGIVFGAGFNEKLQLVSMQAEMLNDLEPLYRSKYLQVNLQGNCRHVKQALENGRWVLFCSTPCNVQGLKNYLGKEYERLILVDFVCHGVASQDLFDKSVRWYEEKNKKKLVSFDFRSKEHKINCSRVFEVVMEDKSRVQGTYLDFPHYFLYMMQISLQSSCYSCEYASDKRCSDITVGDFHMPEKYVSRKERLAGLSSVLCNTEKGYELVQELSIKKKEVTKEEIVKYNIALQSATENKEHVQFFEDYSTLTFERLLEKYGYFSFRTKVKRIYYRLPKVVQEVIRQVLIKD